MKIMMILLLLGLTACTSHTEFGACVGLDEDKDPKLVYKLSAWNVAMGIIFIGLIFPPLFVAIDETFCPVGNK